MKNDHEIEQLESSLPEKNLGSEKEEAERKAQLKKEVEKTRLFLDNPKVRKTWSELVISSGARLNFSLPTIMANYESFHKTSMPGGEGSFFSKDPNETPDEIIIESPETLPIELISERLKNVGEKLTKFYNRVNSEIDRAKQTFKQTFLTAQQSKGNPQAIAEHLISPIKSKASKIMFQEQELIPIKNDIILINKLQKTFEDFIKLDEKIVESHILSLTKLEKEVANLFTAYESFMAENKDFLDLVEFYRWHKKIDQIMANPKNENFQQHLLNIIATCDIKINLYNKIITELQNFRGSFLSKINDLADLEDKIQSAPIFVQEYTKSILDEIPKRAGACSKAIEDVMNLIKHPKDIKNEIIQKYSQTTSLKNEEMDIDVNYSFSSF